LIPIKARGYAAAGTGKGADWRRPPLRRTGSVSEAYMPEPGP